MKERTAEQQRRQSLKWSMVKMILLGWVLPVVLVIAGAGSIFLHNLASQTRQSLQLNAENALDLVVARMDSAIVSSRNASYIPTIKEAWQVYTHQKDAVKLYESVSQFLYQQYKYDEKFKNVIVTFLDDSILSFYTTNVTAGGSTTSYRDYRNNMEPDILEQSQKLGTAITFVERKGRMYLVRNLVDSSYRPFAVLVMEMNTELLFRDLMGLSDAQQVVLWLNDTQLMLMDDSQANTEADAKHKKLQPLQLQYDNSELDSDGVSVRIINDNTLKVQAQASRTSYRLRCAMQVRPAALQSQRNATYFALISIFVLLLPLMAYLFCFFGQKVNRPLAALTEAASDIEDGNFGVQVDAMALTSSEMGYLGDTFNSMSNTLLNQFERIYKEELALRDARIMALQSQINPHFLNNTLEIINWEARMNGDLKVCSMLESLSTMLEAAMDRKHRPLVHLSEELMYADAYLYIIGERLGKRLTVQKEIDDSLLDCYVPRLILQPIMENAVEHGIKPTQKGTIILRARQENHWLLLEVENDGVTTYEDLMKIQELLGEEQPSGNEKSTSLGIRNVHQRLRILYGPESGVVVKITKNGTTLCSIKIDLSQVGQE